MIFSHRNVLFSIKSLYIKNKGLSRPLVGWVMVSPTSHAFEWQTVKKQTTEFQCASHIIQTFLSIYLLLYIAGLQVHLHMAFKL